MAATSENKEAVAPLSQGVASFPSLCPAGALRASGEVETPAAPSALLQAPETRLIEILPHEAHT